MKKLAALSSLAIWMVMCTSQVDQEGVYEPELDARDMLRYKKYLVEGKGLYNMYCSSCHAEDGSGLSRLYPPLAKSDYFLSDIPRSACLIKFGIEGKIIVNELDYNMAMPAMSSLSPLEIAEILTYTGNNWGNEAGFITVKQVEAYLAACEPVPVN